MKKTNVTEDQVNALVTMYKDNESEWQNQFTNLNVYIELQETRVDDLEGAMRTYSLLVRHCLLTFWLAFTC